MVWQKCTYAIEVVDQVRYADERQDMHVDLTDNTFLHRFVVQVRDVGRVDGDILLDNAVVMIVASHVGLCNRFGLNSMVLGIDYWDIIGSSRH